MPAAPKLRQGLEFETTFFANQRKDSPFQLPGHARRRDPRPQGHPL